jgi:uncharacterized protein (DUF952 family)
MVTIYKIFRSVENDDFVRRGETEGAPVDIADGFIHFSTVEQVAETAAKHFSGETDLKLLALDADLLGDDLRWEPSRGGQLFPHLYRRLRIDDILWTRDLPLGAKGHEFGDLLS